MNQEECLQIVRASTRARKYVMVQQEKSPSEPEKHNTEFVTEKNWFSFDKVSISSMKIQPKVYTDSSKCLWRRSCWFCTCTSVAGWVVVVICMAVSIPSLWSSSLRAVCSAVWHWRLLAPHCRWALSRFCASCSRRFRASRSSWSLRSYSLSVRCSVSHRQVLFVFAHAASEDGVVTALSLALVRFWCFLVHPFIAAGSCFKKIARGKLYSQEVQSHWNRSVRMRTTCGSSWTLNHPKSRWRRA